MKTIKQIILVDENNERLKFEANKSTSINQYYGLTKDHDDEMSSYVNIQKHNGRKALIIVSSDSVFIREFLEQIKDINIILNT